MTREHQAGISNSPPRDSKGEQPTEEPAHGVDIDVSQMTHDSIRDIIEKLRTRTAERDRLDKELARARRDLARSRHQCRQTEEELSRLREEQARQLRQRGDQMRTAQKALSDRRKAIETVYAMATAFNGSLDALIDQMAVSVANCLGLDFVGIVRICGQESVLVAQLYNEVLSHPNHSLTECPPVSRLAAGRHAYHTTDELCTRCPAAAEPGGESGLFSQIGIPLIGRDGTLVGVICGLASRKRAFRDYEQHLMEIFGRYLANELSRAELEKRLRRAEELQLLGQLTSGVAHEVRNPLNGIVAMIEALFEELGDDTGPAVYRRHINNQVERLSALMEDLLTLAKPIKDENKQPTSLPEVIAEAGAACRDAHADRNCPVETVVPDEAQRWRVPADGYKLQQVLINLLENAIQHSPQDSPIRVMVDSREEATVRVRIVDGGSGIEPEMLTRVFEPFFTTRKSGTGLGLSIVRHIVQSHGGKIRLYNNAPAPGLTAEIVLPRAQHSTNANNEPSTSTIAEVGAPGSKKRR